jgi:hypothetical protein
MFEMMGNTRIGAADLGNFRVEAVKAKPKIMKL